MSRGLGGIEEMLDVVSWLVMVLACFWPCLAKGATMVRSMEALIHGDLRAVGDPLDAVENCGSGVPFNRLRLIPVGPRGLFRKLILLMFPLSPGLLAED